MKKFIDLTHLARRIRIWLTVALALISASALPQVEAQDITVESICDNRLSITWKSSQGAAGYRFTPIGEGGGKVKCSDSRKKCVIEGLKSGKVYEYYLDRMRRDGVLEYGDPIQLQGPTAGACSEYIAATPTPAPRPPVDTCSNLPGGIVVRGYQPFSTQCQQVSEAGVGNDDLIAQGILDAVDVWGNVEGETQVCFRKQGRLKFLDAATSPRAVSDLQAERIDGMTCGWIHRAGTVALLLGAALEEGAQAEDERVCATGNLRVRAGPSMDDEVIGFVRRSATLLMLSRDAYWIEIEYQAAAGWVGAAYVSEDCG